MFLTLLCLSLICGAVSTEGKKDRYRGHRLISVQATNEGQVKYLRDLQRIYGFQLDFWNEPTVRVPTEIRIPPGNYRRVQMSLREAGLEPTVIQEDIQKLIDDEANKLDTVARSRNALDYNATYLTFEQVIDEVKDLESNSDRINVHTYDTTTVEGRSLYYVHLSSDFTANKPAIWVEAGTHAREWITVSMALFMIDKLSGNDADAVSMLEKFDWYIVPVHNPDGYSYSHSSERLWRKNRKEHYCCTFFGLLCGTYYGTDLNRNWNVNHGGTGSSDDCSTDTYHGGSAFSEVETSFLRDMVQQTNTNNRVKAFFSIHSFSQLMLVPHGHTATHPSDYTELYDIAEEAVAELENVHGTVYKIGTPPDILYVASGGAYDYFKVVEGIKYTYTYELRPNENAGTNGFLLPTEQIIPTIEETWASFVKFAELIPDD